MFDCTDTLRPALDELLDAFEIKREDNSCRVVTPFQHHNGDLIRVWVQGKSGDRLLVRDYGETFAMLEVQGVNPNSDSNKPRIQSIRNRFNLASGQGGEVAVYTTPEELDTRICDVIQACQAISYLMYTHQSRQPSHFRTTVSEYLREVGYDLDTNVDVRGATQEREFDIGINHRDPNILLDTIHSNRKSAFRQQLDPVKLNWWEIQGTDYVHGVVVDDVDGKVDEEAANQLGESLDYYFKWSNKQRITQEIPV